METQLITPQLTTPLPLHLDQLRLDQTRQIHVVRDDLLPAGTKQRAVVPLLPDLKRKGIRHVTYSSPFAGFAQVALAYGCREVGIECTLFSERDPGQPGIRPHDFTKLAADYGAEIILVDNLALGEANAALFAEAEIAHKIPLGFQCCEFQNHFQSAASLALAEIRKRVGSLPKRIWLPVGSGALARAFHEVAPPSVSLHCVDVHVLKSCDLRIDNLRQLPRVKYYSAAEEFRERAVSPPPLPSNIHYDAKVWSFVAKHAEDGDLWWNVAR